MTFSTVALFRGSQFLLVDDALAIGENYIPSREILVNLDEPE